MVVDPYARAVTRLGQLVGGGTESAPDADLLRRYVAARDEVAFAALVRRHGPMVFGVCRRTLGQVQDAEDAFQATFLVLARKANTVRPGGLSRWLYGVAVRVAQRARVRRARRLAVQRELESVEPAAPPTEAPRDWMPLLDTALAKLADRDRRPISLCDLLGRSRAEAAAELGIAEGTLSSRLARARDKLRARLARLGAALSLPTLAAGLADEATATVPSSLIQSTVVANMSAVAARELAEGVIRTMFLVKTLKVVAVTVGVAGALAAGIVWLPTGGDSPRQGKTPAGVLAAAPGKDPPKADSERLRELQKERVEALKEQLQGQFERVKIGKDPMIQLLDAIRELYEAELEIADSREARLAAMERAVTDLKLVEEQVAQLQAAGLQTKQGVAQAKAARLKAEIQLEKIKLGR
ncbi:MAG TPA: sigma-70 family RNA polymerase sigma factor [Gemmataceae bacterium]|nr:sigma-70 family RNA polymerase sigma factor [Gemmataceae bacterium]